MLSGDLSCEHRNLKIRGHLLANIGATENPWRLLLAIAQNFLKSDVVFLHADVKSASGLCVRVFVRTFCLHVTFSLDVLPCEIKAMFLQRLLLQSVGVCLLRHIVPFSFLTPP